MGAGFRRPSEDEVRRDWEQFTGGPPVIGILGEYAPGDVEALAWRDEASAARAMVTWAIRGDAAEIVSVHADPPGSGGGNRIMDAAEEQLRRRGVRRIVLATTNDNVRALAFYQKRGYRLVRLHLDAMDRVRARKARVPQTGREGLPLRDMWELEKEL